MPLRRSRQGFGEGEPGSRSRQGFGGRTVGGLADRRYRLVDIGGLADRRYRLVDIGGLADRRYRLGGDANRGDAGVHAIDDLANMLHPDRPHRPVGRPAAMSPTAGFVFVLQRDRAVGS